MKTRRPLAVEFYEAEQINRAVYFTVCRFLGVGTYDTRKVPTIAEARQLAPHMGGRCMIYAVTPEGYSIHVENYESTTKQQEKKPMSKLKRITARVKPSVGKMLNDALMASEPKPAKKPAKAKAAKTPKAAKPANKKAAARALDNLKRDLDGAAIPAPAKKAKAEPKPAALGKRAQTLADAEAGKVPPPPDFSAPTHDGYRKRLEALVALVKARDLKGLKAVEMLKPYNSSTVALHRYRDLAMTALAAAAK
jgi:hypothetical protein